MGYHCSRTCDIERTPLWEYFYVKEAMSATVQDTGGVTINQGFVDVLQVSCGCGVAGGMSE